MPSAQLRSRLAALFALLVAIVCIVGALAAQRLKAVSESMDSIYKDRILCQQQLRAVDEAYSVQVMAAVRQVRDGTLRPEGAIHAIDEAGRSEAREWSAYLRSYLTPHESALVARATPALAATRSVTLQTRRLLAAGDRPGLDALAIGELPRTVDTLSVAIGDLLDLQLQVARELAERSHDTYRDTIALIIALVSAALLSGGVLTWATVRRYTREVHEHESRLDRLNDFYWTLSRTNQLIVREVDEARLLNEICRICVEHGHARVAVVSLLDGELASRVAHAGPAEEFFDGITNAWNPGIAPFSASITGRALRLGEHAVSNDFQHEAPAAAWRDRAAAVGVCAAAAFPLFRQGRVIGALGLYAREKGFFDDRLLRLLDEMVGDVSFALDNFDREAQRREAQAQTRAHLERFRRLFKAAPVSMYISRFDNGAILEANDVFCARYGHDRDALVGRSLAELGLGLSPENFRSLRELLRRDGQARNLELEITSKDGTVLTILVNADMLDYDGQECVLAMSLDVTELRQAERSREARTAAEAASRAKTAFLSNMSHELRTPLNAVLGFTQLMRREGSAARSAQDSARLDIIHRSARHLLSLVNDVLDVSRIESGAFDVRKQPTALAPLLEEVLLISEAQASQAGIGLEADFRGELLGGALADPIRLRQALINLLTNAVKYNRPGGSVRLQAHADAQQVVIRIIDSGIGMSAEQVEHLYEPFNRLGRERGNVEGTGLGLALTRQLVRQMDGELEIESVPGQGTTARVTLRPAALAPAEPPAAGSSPPPGDAEPTGTVLYIEDNEINVMLVEEMLAPWHGVRLVHAADGRDGLEQARLLRPDLLLLDMQLPDMDGGEILRALSADAATRDIRVVAMSASAMAQEVEQARAGGALDYWTKPLDVDQFLDGVARLLLAEPA